MDERLKRRLVGTAVLVSLIVIFVPMLLEDRPEERAGVDPESLLAPDEGSEAIGSPRILPLEGERLSEPPAPAPAPTVIESEPTRKTEPVSAPEEPRAAPPVAVIPTESPLPTSPADSSPVKPVAKVGLPTPAPAPSKPDIPDKAPSPQAWVVQVGSFSSEQNAANLVDELLAARFPAFREQARVGGKTVHRVRVGPEVDRKQAEAMAAGIGKRFKLKCEVVRYP